METWVDGKSKRQIILACVVFWAFVMLAFTLWGNSDSIVYRDTHTKEVVGCSIDGAKVPATNPTCKRITHERPTIVWVKPGWEIGG